MRTIEQSFLKNAALMDEYIRKAAGLTDEQFHRIPDNGGWSVQQVILHLIIASEGIIQIMEKKVSRSGELKKSDFSAVLRSVFLTIMLKLPLKFKAPKVIADTPNHYSWQEISIKWNSTKERYLQFLSNFPSHMEDKLIFKHPVAGWFNLEQSIQFLGDHISHHERQIQALYH